MIDPWIETADVLDHLYPATCNLASAFSGNDGFVIIYFVICEYGEVLAYDSKEKLCHRAQISFA